LNSELRALVRKELRSMMSTYVVVLILVVLETWSAHRYDTLSSVALLGFLPAFLGAVTFAQEKQGGTIRFLVGLPVSRRRIFASKLAVTAPVVLAISVVVFMISARKIVLGIPWYATWTDETMRLHLAVALLVSFIPPAALYAFGVLLSLVVDTVVIATLGAIALFAIVGGALYLAYYEVIGLFAGFSDAAMSCVVAGSAVLGVAVVVGTLLVARRLFCGRAGRERRPG